MAISGVISDHFTPALWRRNTKRVFPRKHIGADSSWKGFSPAKFDDPTDVVSYPMHTCRFCSSPDACRLRSSPPVAEPLLSARKWHCHRRTTFSEPRTYRRGALSADFGLNPSLLVAYIPKSRVYFFSCPRDCFSYVVWLFADLFVLLWTCYFGNASSPAFTGRWITSSGLKAGRARAADYWRSRAAPRLGSG